MLTRRSFLSALAALPGAAAETKPNLIVVYTDDQGIGDLGCYGGRDVKTPHLDRLASSGVRFTNWYTNSPVCSPSRCAVLTGQYPVRHGIRNFLPARATLDVPGLRADAVTLPGELRKLGYHTAQIGKWHLGSAPGSRPLDQGFDEQFGFLSGWHDYYSHRYYQMSRTGPEHIFPDLWRNGKPVSQEGEYATDLFSREAVSLIERRKSGDKPFFLYLAYGAPHYPMMAPTRYLQRFPESMDPERRLFAAMVAAVDDGVGAIVAALKKRGIERNTVIFFQSDNGATIEARADAQGRPYRGGSNAPFRGYKGGLFEGGIRMPALLSWPGRIAPAVVEEPGAAIDILPTYLQWAGGSARDVDGANVEAMLRGGASPHQELFWEYQGQFAVRRGPWKLMQKPKEGLGLSEVAPLWLSNLKEDPGEKENWAARAPGVVSDLQARLERWKSSVGIS